MSVSGGQNNAVLDIGITGRAGILPHMVVYVLVFVHACCNAGKGKSLPQPSPCRDYVVAQGGCVASQGAWSWIRPAERGDEGPELLGAQDRPLLLQLRLSE